MPAADVFVAELKTRHRDAVGGLVAAYAEGLVKEAFAVDEFVRLEMRAAIEDVEIAALWLVDSDALDAKLALAERAGDRARHHARLAARLGELAAAAAAGFDARAGGYSKLFAFLRQLQTTEERAAAGPLGVAAAAVARQGAAIAWLHDRGDPQTATLLRDLILPDEDRFVEAGRRLLLGAATSEESQARARRAFFRVLELLRETLDAAAQKKHAVRSAHR